MAKPERVCDIKPVQRRWIRSRGGTGRHTSHLRRVVQGGLASAVAVVGLVAFATPAFAHDNIVSATANCASPAGSGYTVVWTVQNDYNATETGSVTSVTGGLSTLSSTTFSIAASPGQPYSSTTVTQTLPPSASGPITIDISSTWSDSYSTTDVGTYDLSQLHCAAPNQTIAGSHLPVQQRQPDHHRAIGWDSGGERSDARVGDAQPARTDGGGRRRLHHDGDRAAGVPARRLWWLLDAERVGKHGHGVGHCAERWCRRGHLLRDSGDPDHRGHIYLCNNANPTTTEQSGGTLGASGATPVSATPNPLAPTEVGAGAYTMTATAPPGYQLVVCGGSSTPSASGSTATESVTVPSGGAGVGIFYVTPVTQTIAGSHLSVQQRQPDHHRAIGWDSGGERSDARVGDAQPARTDGGGRRRLHHDGDPAAGVPARRLWWLLDAERVRKHGHGVGHCAERWCRRGHLLRRGHQPGHESHGDYDGLGRSGQLR